MNKITKLFEKNKGDEKDTIDVQLENQYDFAELEKDVQWMKAVLKHFPADLRRLKRDITKPILWNNERQKEILLANGFGDIDKSEDYADKYRALVRGLDEESAGTVNKILLRHNLILNSDEENIDLFTMEEQEELRYVRAHFNKEILKISDSLYAWRKYLLPYNHFEASVFWYRHGLEKVNDLSALKGKAIVDVGGYIGDSVLILSELDAECIVTFEADPNNYEMLKQTIKMNEIENVICENRALGAEEGTITVAIGDSSSSTVNRPGFEYTGSVEIPMTTLDAYVEKHKLNVGLIKVDIEGAETDFLKGAKETICAQKPIILLSIYHNAHDFFELKPMLESWNAGYKFKIYKPTLKDTTAETLLIAEAE